MFGILNVGIRVCGLGVIEENDRDKSIVIEMEFLG